MQLTEAQINKYYSYAQAIAGELYRDLFHHVYCDLPEDIRHPDAYIYRAMFNAFTNKKSTFNKFYRIEDTDQDVQIVEEVHVHSKYDSFLLHKILLELEMEGLDLEVSIYKEVRLVSNCVKLSKKIGITPKTLSKIVNFIEDEIRHRYIALNT